MGRAPNVCSASVKACTACPTTESQHLVESQCSERSDVADICRMGRAPTTGVPGGIGEAVLGENPRGRARYWCQNHVSSTASCDSDLPHPDCSFSVAGLHTRVEPTPGSLTTSLLDSRMLTVMRSMTTRTMCTRAASKVVEGVNVVVLFCHSGNAHSFLHHIIRLE